MKNDVAAKRKRDKSTIHSWGRIIVQRPSELKRTVQVQVFEIFQQKPSYRES